MVDWGDETMSDFIGTIDKELGRHEVYVDGDELNPRYDLTNHSPDGFNWGYLGSGPAQLALAMLAHVTDDDTALACYQAFKFQVIVKMDMDKGFVMHKDCVKSWVREYLEVSESAADKLKRIQEMREAGW